MKNVKALLVASLVSLVAAPAFAALPDLEVKTSIQISSVTTQEGQPTRREKDRDFRNSLFFTRSNSVYNYSLDYFLSEKGLRGRLCNLTPGGQLVECFTIRQASSSSCEIQPYNQQTDLPKRKNGFTERDLKRAFDYAGIGSASAREQIGRVNLGMPGTPHKTKFKAFTVAYAKGRAIELGAAKSDLDYIRARGEVACKRLFQVILPDLRSR